MKAFLGIWLLGIVGVVQGGFFDRVGSGLGHLGSYILPEDSTRAACFTAGLYNREPDGGPLLRDASGGIFGAAGTVIGTVIDTVGTGSTSENACISAGYYDPTLDARGNPKGGQGHQLGGGNINMYTQRQQHNTQTTAYKCLLNGVQVPCDAATIAQTHA